MDLSPLTSVVAHPAPPTSVVGPRFHYTPSNTTHLEQEARVCWRCIWFMICSWHKGQRSGDAISFAHKKVHTCVLQSLTLCKPGALFWVRTAWASLNMRSSVEWHLLKPHKVQSAYSIWNCKSMHLFTSIAEEQNSTALWSEIERSGKMPLRPDPELRQNQIPKHMPVSGAPVKADASVKSNWSGKTGQLIR